MLKIALDIDDTVADFLGTYYNMFGAPKTDSEITKNVYKLRKNKDFWENLPVLETIDFTPSIYATKRINSKEYTKNWIKRNNFPLLPIYQMYIQNGNKADMVKGKCDVLIDDSVSNVLKCNKSGVPALLIDRPHNQWFGPQFRIFSLSYSEIEEAYELLKTYA